MLNFKTLNKMEQLIITALNRAIKVYKTNTGQPMWGDIVASFNSENTKVATFIERHPGCIMLPVKLEEGSGYFFLKSESTMFGNCIYIAWEEDNSMHPLRGLISDMSYGVSKDVASYFEEIIMKHLF